MSDVDELLRMLEERAAQYGALRKSSLTAIALDRASDAVKALTAENERLRAALGGDE